MSRLIQHVPDGVRMKTRFGDVLMTAVSDKQVKVDLISVAHPITLNGVAYDRFYGYVQRDEDGIWRGVHPGSWDSILRIRPAGGDRFVDGSSELHELLLVEMLRVAAEFEAQHSDLLAKAAVVQANNRLISIEEKLAAARRDCEKLEAAQQVELDIIERHSGSAPKP